ncbi:MAG: universal stress protein [Acidimicrobiales bacterium]
MPNVEANPSQTREVAVTLDGSGRDARALTVVTDLAERFALSVVAVTVAVEDSEFDDRVIQLSEAVGDNGFAMTTIVDHHIPNGIVRGIQGRVAVMATRADPFVLDSYAGSVAEAVASATTASLVLVGPSVDTDRAWDIDQVIAPVSSNLESLVAIPVAAEWARRFDVPLTCVHIDDSGTIAHGPSWWPPRLFGEETLIVADSSVAEGIGWQAGKRSLLVMGTSARQGLARIAEGSVMTEVVSRAQHPTIVLGPQAHLSAAPFA